VDAFYVIKNCLSKDDIRSLKQSYSAHCRNTGMPCYAFLENSTNDLVSKIRTLVERSIKKKVSYLNDFFFYTSASFSTPWHVDTELYLFKEAVNAWILLDPDEIDNPIGFVSGINTGTNYYQSVITEGAMYSFVNYIDGEILELGADEVEACRINTPNIAVGDILLINPSLFHRTNTTKRKGACIFKFVMHDENGYFHRDHLPEIMWPELAVYKSFEKHTDNWPRFLKEVQKEVNKNGKESPLVSGFYPSNFDYLVTEAQRLCAQERIR